MTSSPLRSPSAFSSSRFQPRPFFFFVLLPSLLLLLLPSPAHASREPCSVPFRGETLTFARCELHRFAPLELYYTTDNTASSIDTLFRVRLNFSTQQWASFGWDERVLAYTRDGRTAHTRRQAANTVTDAEAEVVDGKVLACRYSHKSIGDTALTYGAGSLPTYSADEDIQAHVERHVTTTQWSVRASSSGVSMVRAHSIVMSIAWVVLVPSAVLTMTFLRKHESMSFTVHRSLNTIAVILTLIGFFLVAFRTGNYLSTPRGRRHRLYGYLVTFIAVAQVIAGLTRPRIGARGRQVWYWIHGIAGGILVVLGLSNVFYGISFGFFGDSPKLTVAWYCLAGIPAAAYISALIVLSFFPGKFPRTPQQLAVYREMNEPANANITDDVFR